MVPGGIIIVHDYSTLPGVARALAEFLSKRRERVIELSTTQAMIVRAAETTYVEYGRLRWLNVSFATTLYSTIDNKRSEERLSW